VSDLTAVVLNPLVGTLPPAVVFLGVTCNRFRGEHLKQLLVDLKRHYSASGLEAILGPLLFTPSDGDSRSRRAAILDCFNAEHNSSQRFYAVNDPSFGFSVERHELTAGGLPAGDSSWGFVAHDQDWIQ
jgi:hypothetical protein